MAAREIPWVRVVVEGLVIVDSILLAFGIDAWWTESREADVGDQVLAGLYSDLSATQEAVRNNLAVHRRAFSASEDLLSELRRAKAANGLAAASDSMLSAVLISPTLNPRTGTLDGLLESGELDLVGDVDLQAALRNWPALLVDITGDESLAQDVTWDVLLPAMFEAGDVSSSMEHIMAVYNPDFEATGSMGFTELRPTDQLIEAVLMRMMGLTQATYPMRPLIDTTDELLSALNDRMSRE